MLGRFTADLLLSEFHFLPRLELNIRSTISISIGRICRGRIDGSHWLVPSGYDFYQPLLPRQDRVWWMTRRRTARFWAAAQPAYWRRSVVAGHGLSRPRRSHWLVPSGYDFYRPLLPRQGRVWWMTRRRTARFWAAAQHIGDVLSLLAMVSLDRVDLIGLCRAATISIGRICRGTARFWAAADRQRGLSRPRRSHWWMTRRRTARFGLRYVRR